MVKEKDFDQVVRELEDRDFGEFMAEIELNSKKTDVYKQAFSSGWAHVFDIGVRIAASLAYDKLIEADEQHAISLQEATEDLTKLSSIVSKYAKD